MSRTGPKAPVSPGRHIPERTCVACRRKSAKGDLVRLVSAGAGVVVIDAKGKEKGRGVYLCPFRDCWESALKGARLQYGLRGEINVESKKRLLEYGQNLPVRCG